jgi:hypothetical protein
LRTSSARDTEGRQLRHNTSYARFASLSVDSLSPELLNALQREAFDYFIHEVNPLNGLVADKTQAGSPASIAAVGFALSLYPVGIERGSMTRTEGARRTLVTLRFFRDSVQSASGEATGYKGFYYHFLDMIAGRRVWKCELSTIDTALLLAGMATALKKPKFANSPMPYIAAQIGTGHEMARRR